MSKTLRCTGRRNFSSHSFILNKQYPDSSKKPKDQYRDPLNKHLEEDLSILDSTTNQKAELKGQITKTNHQKHDCQILLIHVSLSVRSILVWWTRMPSLLQERKYCILMMKQIIMDICLLGWEEMQMGFQFRTAVPRMSQTFPSSCQNFE